MRFFNRYVHADADGMAASALPFTEVMACLLFVTTMAPMVIDHPNLSGFSDRLAAVNAVADISAAGHPHVITASAAGLLGIDGKPLAALFENNDPTRPNPRLDEEITPAVAVLRGTHPLLAIDRATPYERGLAVRTILQRLHVDYVEIALSTPASDKTSAQDQTADAAIAAELTTPNREQGGGQ